MELKNEHKPKKESTAEWVARTHKEKYGEKVKTVWRVEEHIDGYDQDDNYIPNRARCLDASEWFNTKEEAEELMKKMKPSSDYWGAYLKLGSRSLYRKWIPPRDGYYKDTWI